MHSRTRASAARPDVNADGRARIDGCLRVHLLDRARLRSRNAGRRSIIPGRPLIDLAFATLAFDNECLAIDGRASEAGSVRWNAERSERYSAASESRMVSGFSLTHLAVS